MKPVSEMTNQEIVSWIRALDLKFDAEHDFTIEETEFHYELVQEIVGRGFDLQGNPHPTLYSELVRLRKATDELVAAIIHALPRWMQRWFEE